MQTDEQLMTRYVAGDRRAFAALHARYEPIVRRLASRHARRRADIDDLVQQTFTQLHAARGRYRDGERLKPWLCTMARNTCLDYLRRKRRRPETALELDSIIVDEPPVREGELSAERRALVLALEGLPDETRQIFHRHFVDGLALADIARELGANPTTVRVRVHRGCRQLREELTIAPRIAA